MIKIFATNTETIYTAYNSYLANLCIFLSVRTSDYYSSTNR